MSSAIAGWRLPFRLALRDLRRYRGRSTLAALLILLPVLTMAGLFSFIRTVDVTPAEDLERSMHGISAVIDPAETRGSTAMPAAGRVIDGAHPPTAAEVSKQAGVPVTSSQATPTVFATSSGGPAFIATESMFLTTDLTSPVWKGKAELVSGRLPRTAGEIVVTEFGISLGLPRSGALDAAVGKDGYSGVPTQSDRRTVVGVITTPIRDTAAAGPGAGGDPPPGTSYLIGKNRAWSDADVAQWKRYGLLVTTPAVAREQLRRESVGSGTPPSDTALALAMATMAFIAVTALLAGPAFAASATRQRRALGLVAANGGTRAVLRRIVLAHALLLGALTSLVGAVLGSILGVLAARWLSLRASGIVAPVDVKISWLVGLIAVSTVAALVAAWVPARAAGRTDLLQALRGPVSSRRVSKRWPTLGVIGVVAGTGCLYLATLDRAQGRGVQTLLVYLGVPMFFGGAVLAVPYVLAATGRLAAHLPLTPRIAVRDVSRQRTRATASIGAVLATVAVCAGASVLGASVDADQRRHYVPSLPMNTAVVMTGGYDTAHPPTRAQGTAQLARVRGITPSAVGVWAMSNPGTRSVSIGTCPKKLSDVAFEPGGTSTAALDDSGLRKLRLTNGQRAVLDAGGFLWVKPTSPRNPMGSVGVYGSTTSENPVKNGQISLVSARFADRSDGMPAPVSCRSSTSPAAVITDMATHLIPGMPIGGLVTKRSTLEKRHLAPYLAFVAVAPEGGVSPKLEGQLRAAVPDGSLQVERGYSSPVALVLTLMTAGLTVLLLLTTVVATLLDDAESQADAATLATVGAPAGMRRRIVGAHAAALGVIGALIGIAVGITPGLIMARTLTRRTVSDDTTKMSDATYVVPWWPLLTMLVAVPLVAALVSMLFARRHPMLTRREA